MLAVLLCLVMTGAAARPVGSGRQDDAGRLIQRLGEQQRRLPAWRADLLIDIDMPGMRVKGKKATLAFTPPDRFDFQSRGFVILPRKAFMWTADSLFAGLSEPRLLPARRGDPAGSARLGGVFRENGLLARMDYRVDTLRWLVTQVSTWHDTLEAVRLDNEWRLLGGAWLPAAVRVRMSLSPELQKFYERFRGTMRQRREPRQGAGTILITLSGHQLGDAKERRR
jgi:hypothetical protein